MNSRELFGTIVCAVLVSATISTTVPGQDSPAADGLLAGYGEDSAPSIAAMMAEQPQYTACDDVGCFESCCCPRWTASADFIILDRLGGANQTLVNRVPNVPTSDRLPGIAAFGILFGPVGTEALNSKDMQQGFSGGPRIGLVRHGDSGYDLELSYFQIDGWSSNKSIVPNDPTDCLVMRAPGQWVFPVPLSQPAGWIGWIQTNQGASQAMAWQYASRLYNAEFNVRWNPCCRVTMLAGFRWVSLHESLVGALSPPTVSTEPPFWTTTTSNNLYGFQIGADATVLEYGRFSINTLAKAGLCDNNAVETCPISVIAKQIKTASDMTNHAAFVGEIGLQCKYQLTDDLLLRAGYEVIALDGVALAPGQVQETYMKTNFLNSTVRSLGVNCNSGAFYQGATVGLEYSF